MRKIEVNSGDRYGMTTILREVPSPNRYRRVEIKCDCGNTKVIQLNDLRSGATKSCGCYLKKRISQTHTTHGNSGTPEYHAWWDMLARCTNPKNKYYDYYGGRGIVVCDRWQEDFLHFLSDVGRKPFPKAQLDRIDNNEGYHPNNVRWTTAANNNGNKSNSKIWTIFGVEYPNLPMASKALNTPPKTLYVWCKGWVCRWSGKKYPPKENCSVRLLYED